MRSPLAVGIVGSGIAGSSTSLFIRRTIPGATIRVFERAEAIGGRIQSKGFCGAQIETGASFFHSSNRLIMKLADDTGLTLQALGSLRHGQLMSRALWDGRRFIMQTPQNRFIVAAQLLKRYGWSAVHARRAVALVLKRWACIYDLQSAATFFPSPIQLLRDLRLSDVADRSTYDFLSEHQVKAEFIREVVASVCRGIYNQDAHINGFAGVVSLVSTGMLGGTMFSIANGNVQLCERLLRLSGAELHMKSNVRELRSSLEGRNRTVTVVDDAGHRTCFDAVILAAPWKASMISLRQDGALQQCKEQQSITTYVVCVAGRLAPRYFGVTEAAHLPSTILTLQRDNVPFSTLTRYASSPSASYSIYKIQSRFPLGNAVLHDMFEEIRDVSTTTWNAYPPLRPTARLSSFALADGVFYPSAFEAVASTLETQAVSSQNVVRMMATDVQHRSANKSVCENI